MSFVGRPTYGRMHACLSGCQECENQLMAMEQDQDVTTPLEKRDGYEKSRRRFNLDSRRRHKLTKYPNGLARFMELGFQQPKSPT